MGLKISFYLQVQNTCNIISLNVTGKFAYVCGTYCQTKTKNKTALVC